MNTARAWLVSLRLRTLPLALASTGMGSFLAAGFGVFSLRTCLLTSLTAILLQILSNLANDYGDYKTGADNEDRLGPQRALQSGSISIAAMRNAIIFVALLTLASGSVLLYTATERFSIFITFFIIGLLCIAAAIKYTMGKNPYGYSGLGDIAVFIFFGIVGVGGTFYLHAHYFKPDILLPACTMGFLSAGVLNVNNMRDINNDAASGKNTLVVRMGLKKAKRYHTILITFAFISLAQFTLKHLEFCLAMDFFNYHTAIFSAFDSCYETGLHSMDKYLKQLALSTLFLVICFGISISLNPYV